MKVLGQMQG